MRRVGLSAALLCLLLAGCGARYDQEQMLADHARIESDFKAGRVRLDCVFGCTAAKAGGEAELSALYANSQWVDLSEEVIRIGARNDLAYFYLGSAAEGRGFMAAAKIYYRLAVEEAKTGYNCDQLMHDACFGVVLPRDAEERLKHLP